MSDEQKKKVLPAYHITMSPFSKEDRVTYFVSLNVSGMLDDSEDQRSLIVWLHSLPETATVEFSFHTGSTGRIMRFCAYTAVFNAITTCKAQTVGVVDHFFSDMDAYFLLVCESLIISPYGQIVLSGAAANEKRVEPEFALAFNEFCHTLIRNAEQAGLITAEESESIISGNTIYLSPSDLADRIE